MTAQPPTPAASLAYSPDPLDNLGYLLTRAKSILTNMVTQRTQTELGITGTQASMLFMISMGKCTTAAELAREYAIDASAVTRLLDRVEKRGLLKRVRSIEDRRIVRLELTEDGRTVAAGMPAIFRSVLDEAFEGFAPEEIEVLKVGLRRLIGKQGECPLASGGRHNEPA